MRTGFKKIRLLNRLPLAVLLFAMLALNGCASIKGFPSFSQQNRDLPSDTFERNEFQVAREDDVIGRLRAVTLEKGDTLPDIARHFDLGLNVLTASNPGVDVWVPEAGTQIVLPTSFILPDSPRKGIVINLASMRLFKYRGDGQAQTVLTFPAGVGKEERPSPMGSMTIDRKVFRPTWYVPAKIAEDRRKKGDILPAKVPPGPLNPLGEHALYLSKPTYLIHGTNKPSSIGLRATNGCIRLYPEDIRRLYESTPTRTDVNIVYQPYLLGRKNGLVYLEVHASTDSTNSAEFDKIYKKLKQLEKTSGRNIDWGKIKKVLAEARGIPAWQRQGNF
jgi:L,D-transpeptidase ErfK/SrfK